jgi:alpha-beta hydrolase superfamily lysophospholipase
MDSIAAMQTFDTIREDGTFAAPDVSPGVTFLRLSVRPRNPANERARLAIVHGYGDHAGRYVEFMTWLAARGIGCHAFDLRGHGGSSGRRAFVERWEEYLDDLDAFLEQLQLHARAGSTGSEVPLPVPLPAPLPAPLFVLGHSHGGLVVAAAGVRHRLERHNVRGVILCAPYLVNAFRVPRYKVLAARVADRLCPWICIGSGVRPAMMSSDPNLVAQSRNDPLLLRCATPRWYLTHRSVQKDVLTRARELALPLLVLQGDADPIADPAGAKRFHDAVGSTDKQLITYPGFRHEPLREAARERVFGDVLDWIHRRGGDGINAPSGH